MEEVMFKCMYNNKGYCDKKLIIECNMGFTIPYEVGVGSCMYTKERVPLMEKFQLEMLNAARKKPFLNIQFKILRFIKSISINKGLLSKLLAKSLLGFYIISAISIVVYFAIRNPQFAMGLLFFLAIFTFIGSIVWILKTLT